MEDGQKISGAINNDDVSPGDSQGNSPNDLPNEFLGESPELDLVKTASENADDQPAISPGQLTKFGVLLEVLLVVIALAAAWLFGFYDHDQPVQSWFGDPRDAGWIGKIAIGSLLSVPLLFLIVGILPLWKPFTSFFELIEKQLSPLFVNATVWQLALLSAMAGIGEEILFRWCLQGGLTGLLNPVGALIIASLVFGAMHYLNFSYFVIATGLGIVLGLIYIQFGLLAAISCHAMYDFLALRHIVKKAKFNNVIDAS